MWKRDDAHSSSRQSSYIIINLSLLLSECSHRIVRLLLLLFSFARVMLSSHHFTHYHAVSMETRECVEWRDLLVLPYLTVILPIAVEVDARTAGESRRSRSLDQLLDRMANQKTIVSRGREEEGGRMKHQLPFFHLSTSLHQWFPPPLPLPLSPLRIGSCNRNGEWAVSLFSQCQSRSRDHLPPLPSLPPSSPSPSHTPSSAFPSYRGLYTPSFFPSQLIHSYRNPIPCTVSLSPLSIVYAVSILHLVSPFYSHRRFFHSQSPPLIFRFPLLIWHFMCGQFCLIRFNK